LFSGSNISSEGGGYGNSGSDGGTGNGSLDGLLRKEKGVKDSMR
jgi:hypothetical protein